MKKVFGILAMMLAIAACNKNELNVQDNGITITATLAPKTVVTKVVSDQSTYIKAEWAENEHIAILYEVSSTKYVADATITAVDGSGTATITFTVEAGTANDTPCTLVYPLSAAKDDHTGVKDAATLLAAQDGTLSANLDVRVGEGTIQTTTPGLTVTTQPAAQFAIFKFTTKNSDGSATIDVTSLTVTIDAQDYVITPASATSVLFVALPPISGEAVTFTATGSDSKTYTASKASVTFSAGKYYQSNIKMTEKVAYTVEWDFSELSDQPDLDGGFTYKGVTLQGENGILNFDDSTLEATVTSITFTAPTGKHFKNIVINATETLISGWTNGNTWTGDASSVSFMGYAYGITSIVFTLE